MLNILHLQLIVGVFLKGIGILLLRLLKCSFLLSIILYRSYIFITGHWIDEENLSRKSLLLMIKILEG